MVADPTPTLGGEARLALRRALPADRQAATMTDLTRPPSAGEASRHLVVVVGARSLVGDALVGRLREALGPDHLDAAAEIADLDRRLLGRLGASAAFPPPLGLRWASEPGLVDLAEEAARLLADTRDGAPLVVDDLALSLTLPLWRAATNRPLVGVLVVAEPRAAGAAIAAVGTPLVRGLALYERHLRSAVEAIRGLPVYVAVIDESESEEDLDLITKEVLRFAADPTTNVSDRRAEHKSRSGDPLPAAIDALHDALASLAGPHLSFSADIGEENPWTTELLRLAAELEHVTSGLLWAGRQLESAMRAAPTRRLAREERRAEEDGEDQFHEPAEGEPYRLNASEDRHAYHRWLGERREPVTIGGLGDPPKRKAVTRRPRKAPLFSVLLPVYRPPMWALERAVGSVLSQSWPSWELCIADDGSDDAELTAYLQSLGRVDRRIRVTTRTDNGGIAAATNTALGLASGEFVAFLDQDDELTPSALASVAGAIAAAPDADLLYSDEDKIDDAGERFDPLFKPEWSPDLLLSFAYVCHLTTVRRSLLEELGGLRSAFDGSQDYDLSLRASERARRIVHVPEVLYHWRSLPSSAASGAAAKPYAYEAGRRAVEDALHRRGEEAVVTNHPAFPGRYHVRRLPRGRPLVSIIVPFRDEPALLATCAASLRADPGYDNIELVLVDNGSELPETEALISRLADEPGVRLTRSPGPFNWAAINNAAARESSGELLLFSNNDIEARVPGWLGAMVGHAQRDEVGAVGARLVYPDGAIQHAGVVIGLGGIAGHVLRGLPADHPGYNSMAISTRDCSVVTGACMMVRRDVFESVGGFDELLPVAFNDVDFCLKLRELGLLIVYTPLAELVHHESRSRGHTDDVFEEQRIRARWGHALRAGDPYMNVHLSHWRYWCPLSTAQEDYRWQTYLETSASTRGSSSTT